MEREQIVTSLWEDYENGKGYQIAEQLTEILPKCVDFYEGRHWVNEKKNDKARMPRPTFNQIEMIVNNKVAGILSTPLKIVFNSNEASELANKLTAFNSGIEKEMKLDSLCEEMVSTGAVEGCSVIHVFWDADAVGKRGEYKGAVRAEIIDPLNFIVHNPRERMVQKQEWIMIISRITVNAAKALCKDKRQRAFIETDNDNYKASNEPDDQRGTELVTVLTKYFRKNGEVYYERATKTATITPPTALNPNLIKQSIKQEEQDSRGFDREYKANHREYRGEQIDSAESNLPEEPVASLQHGFKASLYPVEIYQYKDKKYSIYGRGEVHPIIDNNRVVNFNTSMITKAVHDLGAGRLVAKEGAIGKGDTISNSSTKVLLDRYKGGQGYYTLPTTPVNPQTFQLNQNILDMTRAVTGATEVMTGEIMGANQSGTSIAYLQQQAQKPIDKLAKQYKEMRIRLAEIFVQFYILFYEGKEFYYNQKAGIVQDSTEQQLQEPQSFLEYFNGSEYANYDFDIGIEIGAGTQYSEIQAINLLDNLLNGGRINLRTFYKAYPPNLLPNKKELLQDLDEQENGKMQQMEEALEKSQALIEELNSKIIALTEVANNIMPTVQEKNKLKAFIAELEAEKMNLINEFTEKLAEANRQTLLGNQALAQEQERTSQLAELIKRYGEMGILQPIVDPVQTFEKGGDENERDAVQVL